jgi:hypothetical protein
MRCSRQGQRSNASLAKVRTTRISCIVYEISDDWIYTCEALIDKNCYCLQVIRYTKLLVRVAAAAYRCAVSFLLLVVPGISRCLSSRHHAAK